MVESEKPRNRAKESLNKFYRKPIGKDEELTLYWNKWVKTNEQVEL